MALGWWEQACEGAGELAQVGGGGAAALLLPQSSTKPIVAKFCRQITRGYTCSRGGPLS